MDQQRLVLTVVISLVILIGYNELVLKHYRKPPMAPEASAPAGEPGVPGQPAPAAQPAPTGTAVPPVQAVGPLAAPTSDEGLVVVETDLFRATITPVGARLHDFYLKQYQRLIESGSDLLNLVARAEAPPTGGPAADVLPLTLQLGPKSGDAAVTYTADRPSLSLTGTERGEIAFVGDAGGVRVEKRFTFTGNEYLFAVDVKTAGEKAPDTVGLVMTPMPLDHTTSRANEVAVALEGHSLVQKSPSDLPSKPYQALASNWAGFGLPYFLSAAVPMPSPVPARMTAVGLHPVVLVDSPVTDGVAQFAVYVGPKAPDILARAGHSLDRAIDYGWFWFVAIPLLQALKWLHTVTGNYGIAIIVLTTMIKVATIPLTQTTFKNMREMQKIQPQMQKLRERFKDDQAALQKEMMELYRRHHVNPLSGCLPMLLQLPIFVGLYNALSHAIELRHAPFALWINDLSAPDRLIIAALGFGIPVLTILMGITMFLQQWLTPQQGDPVQQRMMMIMPVVFTFMFINLPSGLVLYWLVNNVLTIGQQYWMMQRAT